MDRDTPPPDPERPIDRAVLAALDLTPEPGPYAASLAALRARIAAGASTARTALSPGRRRAPTGFPRSWPQTAGLEVSGRWAAIAASVVLLVLGVGLAARRFLVPGFRSLTPAVREYATAAGQRLTVTLGDGTRVTLGPESRVQVVSGDGGGAVATGRDSVGGPRGDMRAVELEGEAYFAVVHDATRPFAVRAHGAVVRDVGTAFDVRAYPEDAGTRVAVVEGAVAVGKETPQGSCLLSHLSPLRSREACGAPVRAGDVATVVDGAVAVQHEMDIATLTGWISGRLVFDRTPMTEVVTELSRWYGVQIELGNAALANRLYTATLNGESVTETLDALCASVIARRERRGSGYVLYTVGER